MRRLRPRHVAVAQGAFYLATGLWPLVSIRTFERASGPKVAWALALPSRLGRKVSPERADNGPIA